MDLFTTNEGLCAVIPRRISSDVGSAWLLLCLRRDVHYHVFDEDILLGNRDISGADEVRICGHTLI
jgi:hypothetical protein